MLGSLTTSRLLGRVSRLAAPIVLAHVSQTLMGLVDTLMVGRLGTESLAAVGIATLLFSAMATALKSLDVAVQTMVARRDGQGRQREVGPVLGTALVVVLAAGLVATLPGLFATRLALGLISQDPQVVELGGQYYFWRLMGLLPFLAYFQMRGCCDGLGFTRVGMLTGVGMNLVNVVLNYGLIFGRLGLPMMGVKGAALASSLASLAALLMILLVVMNPARRRHYGFTIREFWQRDLVGPMVRLGWPPAVQALGLISGIVVFYAILGRIGTDAQAAGNIVMRLASVAIMPVLGISVAVQTLVSRSLGGRDVRGAWRVGWAGLVCSAGFMIGLGLLELWQAHHLVGAFAPEAPVLAAGQSILRITVLAQILAAVGLTFAGVLRGAGATGQVLAVDVLSGAVLMLPLSWLFGVQLGGGLVGTWWALVIWFAAHALIMTVLFQRRQWLRIRV